ncbi:MAG: hypothetical protein ABI883_01620 [Chthoniobacterales bacterium]
MLEPRRRVGVLCVAAPRRQFTLDKAGSVRHRITFIAPNSRSTAEQLRAAILVGGSIAGVLDISYAILFSGWRGVPAERLLQSVASGLLGASAFAGGWPVAALGLFLHFTIAFAWAAIFYLVARRFPILCKRAIYAGVIYGLFIYGMMNLVVLPLSAFPRKVTFPPLVLATGLLVHMFCIGLPIALATRRAFERH